MSGTIVNLGLDLREWLSPARVVLCASALLIARVVLFVYAYIKARRQFPGPPVTNIWKGNLDETMTEDVHDKWRRWHRQYGPIYQTVRWNGLFSRVIYVGDPRLIRKIANENWPKFPAQYAGFRPLSGSALFAQMDQARWKTQRRGLAPAFQPRTVHAQYPALHKYLLQFADTIDRSAAARGRAVDLAQLHVLLTLDFVGEVAFGAELRAVRDGAACRILQIFHAVLPELMKCGLFPLRAKVPVFESTRAMHRAIAELRGMARAAVEDARRAHEDSQEKDCGAEKGKKIFEILAHHVPRRRRRSHGTHDDFCRGHRQLRNPAIHRKLRDELDALLPADCVVPSIEQVSRLPYLRLVIKETLRYNGPGFGTFRYTPADVEIEGVVLPANTTLALWNPQVHRCPNVWGADADTFRPERWMSTQGEGNEKAALPGSYFPFSYGPRKCMGEGLAMLEMSLTLATLFKRYDLELEPGFEMDFQPSFTLCSRNGLPVYARLRK
ncbi:uncharacterized protein PHACADRAFT_152212 [Phanerochaete carnosa HHB-10118-sp]|uniref:Cytochrome P450 n=1 Tax=Phanerochaete carnosa (strain HHB-10118-sp) TaxID=650164 RepID=K5WMD1_PHACS|nr:uncharacterized protein PHACADRAFT_152212 [Phanerochaete carnosa HHB-10118-sp]EKM51452.1 hypothetical protein PHACADRAFT_152212 [Phanerochaete carnosa HHB-10118-sp]